MGAKCLGKVVYISVLRTGGLWTLDCGLLNGVFRLRGLAQDGLQKENVGLVLLFEVWGERLRWMNIRLDVYIQGPRLDIYGPWGLFHSLEISRF